MSNAPKFLPPIANKAYSILKNANGAAAYKKAAKALGIGFLEISSLMIDAKEYYAAYVWDAASLDGLDWSAFDFNAA